MCVIGVTNHVVFLRRQRGANGDFGNLQIYRYWRLRESPDLPVQSFEGAHRGRICVCVFIGVSVRACCERLRCTVLKKSHLSRELIIDQLVRSLVVEPTHPGSSPRLGTGVRTFLDLFQDFPTLCVKW